MINYRRIKRCIISMMTIMLLLQSCGKTYDLNGFDWEPDLPLSDSVFNREIQVLDLGINNIPEGHRPVDSEDPLFFSLEKFNSIHVGYKSTERWDLAFSGLYRSSLSCNNGSRQGLGYGTNAQGGIMLVDSAFSEVTTVPDDSQFTFPGNIGLALFGDAITGPGHVYYTFFGNIFRPDKMANLDSNDPAVSADANRYLHMMYCLSEDFAKAFPGEYGPNKIKVKPVTIIIRTAKGNYAKLETQSMYKGVMNPMDMYRGTERPLPYYSFRYMVIKADEKRFGFTERKKKLTVNFTTGKTTVDE